MAITGTSRGASIGTTSGSNKLFSPSSNFGSGSYGIFCLGIDGAGTPTVTDSHGNTWDVLISRAETVSSDHTSIIYLSDLSAGVLTTGSVVTVNGVGSSSSSVGAFHQIDTSAYPLSYVTGNSGVARTSGDISITTSSIPTGDLVVASYLKQSSTSITPDGDSTNGSWSTHMTVNDSTGDSIDITTQRKIVTGTGTQTYNPTGFGSTGSRIIIWVQLTELAPSEILDPFGTFGIFGI